MAQRYRKRPPRAPRKKTPFELAHEPLPLDAGEEDLMAFSYEEAVQEFIGRWNQVLHPEKRYPKVPQEHWGKVINIVKNSYRHFVLDSEWEELRFVWCVERTLKAGKIPNYDDLKKWSREYDRKQPFKELKSG